MSDFDWSERLESFRHAGRGLAHVVRTQHNAWIHLTLTLAAVALGVGLAISPLEWCAIVAVIGLVWVAEALNTALEALADAAVPERNPKVGVAKDAAAGAVLLAAVVAAVVGLIVFAPRLLEIAR